MKSLRQETNELRTLVRPPVSQQQQAQAVPPLVTLPELRAMTDLAMSVDQRVEQLGALCSDDSESENECAPLPPLAANSAPPSRPGRRKLLVRFCILKDGLTVFFVSLERSARSNTRS